MVICMSDGWIYCEDEMPPVNMHLMVSVRCANGDCYSVESNVSESGTWFGDTHHDLLDPGESVYAWRELPDPAPLRPASG